MLELQLWPRSCTIGSLLFGMRLEGIIIREQCSTNCVWPPSDSSCLENALNSSKRYFAGRSTYYADLHLHQHQQTKHTLIHLYKIINCQFISLLWNSVQKKKINRKTVHFCLLWIDAKKATNNEKSNYLLFIFHLTRNLIKIWFFWWSFFLLLIYLNNYFCTINLVIFSEMNFHLLYIHQLTLLVNENILHLFLITNVLLVYLLRC